MFSLKPLLITESSAVRSSAIRSLRATNQMMGFGQCMATAKAEIKRKNKSRRRM